MIKGLLGHKGWPLFGLGPALVLQWTLPWPSNTPNMALHILAIFVHSMQQKWAQEILGTQRSFNGPCHGPTVNLTWPFLYWLYFCIICNKLWIMGLWGHKRLNLIGFRVHRGPSMDPAIALKYPQHGPLYIGYSFAFYVTKMGSRNSGDTKLHLHWV